MWVIPRTIVNRVLNHAQRSAPQECVGILSGRGREITDWHPLDNQLARSDRFLADPTQQIQLFKTLREQGQELLAIYHSHPTSPAIPSAWDLDQSAYPEALYLIVSLSTEGCLEMAGYRIQEGVAKPEPLTIKE